MTKPVVPPEAPPCFGATISGTLQIVAQIFDDFHVEIIKEPPPPTIEYGRPASDNNDNAAESDPLRPLTALKETVLAVIPNQVYQDLKEAELWNHSEQCNHQTPVTVRRPQHETTTSHIQQIPGVDATAATHFGPTSSVEESDTVSEIDRSSLASSYDDSGATSPSSEDGDTRDTETEAPTRRFESFPRRGAPPAPISKTGKGPARTAPRITLPAGQKRRGDFMKPTRETKKPRRPEPLPAIHELDDVVKRLRNVDKLCNIPPYSPVNKLLSPTIFLLAAALRGREVIDQFCLLVAKMRDPGNRLRFQHSVNSVVYAANRLKAASDCSLYAKFIKRFGQFHLATVIKTCREKKARLRLDPEDKRNVLKATGWTASTYDTHLAQGRKWLRVCDKHRGLLCFLFLGHNRFGIDPKEYLDMNDKELEGFNELLSDGYAEAIWKAGEALLESLEEPEDIEFRWETLTSGFSKLADLPEETLLSYMQPFPPATKYIYQPANFSAWPRPSKWPDTWRWPADPMAEGVFGCDHCYASTCKCIEKPPGVMPRLKVFGEKGLGLQAIGNNYGDIVYTKESPIGWFFGKILPAGTTANNDLVLNLARPDIDGRPVLCELDYRDHNNCFRRLRRDPHPSARLRILKISCRYVVAVVARKDIYDGSEITIGSNNSMV